MRTSNPLRYLLLVAFAWSSAATAAQPTVVGWIESVRLGNEGLVIPAKLDTGADVSSLGVSDLTWIRRADGDWVAFDVTGKNERKVHLERKVQRIARVKKAAGGVQERPTVLLGVCLGDIYRSDGGQSHGSNWLQVAFTRRPELPGRALCSRSFADGYRRARLHHDDCVVRHRRLKTASSVALPG